MRRILRDAPLDGRELVFRALRMSRFMVGSLPGVGRLDRFWRHIRRAPSTVWALRT
jgi:hypothetical protein